MSPRGTLDQRPALLVALLVWVGDAAVVVGVVVGVAWVVRRLVIGEWW